MVSLDERIPTLSDDHLATLRGNADRLLLSGTAKQIAEAERLLPLIAAEIEQRRANKPPPAARRVAAKPASKPGAKPARKTAAKPAAAKARKQT